MKHMEIERLLMRNQARHLHHQRRLVAVSDHDESLFLERSRKYEVNVTNHLWVAVLT